MYTQTLAIIFDHIQQPQWLLITVDQAWKKISWKTNQAEFLLSISLLKKILLKNLAVCKPAFHSGAPRAKRASGTPWVNKTTHPRKFGNHVTDRPSVRTTGIPMFTLTLSSYFGSQEKADCTSMLWSIDSCQNRVSADQYLLTVSRTQVSTNQGRVFFEVIRWQFTRFQRIAGWDFFSNSYQICCVYVTIAQHYYDFDFKLTSDAKIQPVFF